MRSLKNKEPFSVQLTAKAHELQAKYAKKGLTLNDEDALILARVYLGDAKDSVKQQARSIKISLIRQEYANKGIDMSEEEAKDQYKKREARSEMIIMASAWLFGGFGLGSLLYYEGIADDSIGMRIGGVGFILLAIAGIWVSIRSYRNYKEEYENLFVKEPVRDWKPEYATPEKLTREFLLEREKNSHSKIKKWVTALLVILLIGIILLLVPSIRANTAGLIIAVILVVLAPFGLLICLSFGVDSRNKHKAISRGEYEIIRAAVEDSMVSSSGDKDGYYFIFPNVPEPYNKAVEVDLYEYSSIEIGTEYYLIYAHPGPIKGEQPLYRFPIEKSSFK